MPLKLQAARLSVAPGYPSTSPSRIVVDDPSVTEDILTPNFEPIFQVPFIVGSFIAWLMAEPRSLRTSTMSNAPAVAGDL